MDIAALCRAGTLNVAACEELGVVPGKDYARVKAGESVLSRDGNIVRSDQVRGLHVTPHLNHRALLTQDSAEHIQSEAQPFFPALALAQLTCLCISCLITHAAVGGFGQAGAGKCAAGNNMPGKCGQFDMT